MSHLQDDHFFLSNVYHTISNAIVIVTTMTITLLIVTTITIALLIYGLQQ